MDDTDHEWGPWIDHDGKGCPLKAMGQFCHLWIEADETYNGDFYPRESYVLVNDLIASCGSWHGAK